MNKKTLIIAAVLTFGLGVWNLGLGTCSAQNVGINATGAAPNSSALLDIDGTNGGLLIPRMSTADRNLIASPANSLMIYNTTDNCLQIFIGTWQNIYCGCTSPPGASGSITGSTPVCQNQNGVSYSIPAITGATGYVWTYTGTGFTIASGNNTNSITANFSSTATGGNLTVYATNACGNGTASSAYPITVTAGSGSVIFSYTGSFQTWTVPPCITSITIEALGAQGGSSSAGGTGGLGGRAVATVTVTPGDILYIYVGGAGFQAPGPGPCGGAGFNGGGDGTYNSAYPQRAGGGGGASDVRMSPYTLADRIIVAGGGGGAGSGSTSGGSGGGTSGSVGANNGGQLGGGGGTQTIGGSGGAGYGSGGSGSLGQGGSGCNYGGGGGGGGYYGGGGGGSNWTAGSGACGGGGSGYVTGTGTSMTNGVQSGNGQVTITW